MRNIQNCLTYFAYYELSYKFDFRFREVYVTANEFFRGIQLELICLHLGQV